MKTLIIGANGKIGRILCQQCVQQKIPLRAMIRATAQLPYFEKLGIETVMADLEGDFSPAFAGCERVVFTAGSGGHTGGDKTLLVDLYSAIRAIEESEKRAIRHFIMVSSLRSENPMEGSEKIRHYLVAKKLADEHLMRSSLPYTILRPGRLTEESGSGSIRTDIGKERSHGSISRANVAACILACFNNTRVHGKVMDLLDGDLPISEVL